MIGSSWRALDEVCGPQQLATPTLAVVRSGMNGLPCVAEEIRGAAESMGVQPQTMDYSLK